MRTIRTKTRRGGPSNPTLPTAAPARNVLVGPGAGGGRPSLLTPELVDRICKSIQIGATLREAVLLADLELRTVEYWMSKANPEHADHRPEFAEFRRRVEKAFVEFKMFHSAQLMKSSRGVETVRDPKTGEEREVKFRGNIAASYFTLERSPQTRSEWGASPTTIIAPVKTILFDPSQGRPVVDAGAEGFLLPEKEAP